MNLFCESNTKIPQDYKIFLGIESCTVSANVSKNISIAKPSGWNKITGAIVSGNTNPYAIDYSSIKAIVGDTSVTVIIANPTASGDLKIGYMLFGI